MINTNTTKRFIFLIILSILLIPIQNVNGQERASDFNFDWKFTLVEDTKIPSETPLDDSNWSAIRLPHDWSVEASFDEKLEGCTGYLPGGVGIYQKHFKTPAKPKDKNTFVLFDGVYNNATFWLNGHLLGENPYGYSPTYFDLTPYLNKKSEENIITVHVDHSRYADSRWYSGSGIYRNVKLVTVNKLHIPIWGTFITTPEVSNDVATVKVETKVTNKLGKSSNFTLSTEIFDHTGHSITVRKNKLKLSSGEETTFSQTLQVLQPKLWDPESPNMYKAVSKLIVEDEDVDSYVTPFGIRSLKHDKEQGFFLNGKSTFVKGVCIHHDAGLVGAAVPKGVWKRRLEKLKEAGVNAIRTSHNPFSQEFYDLCDELGLLVQAEIFDEFDNPKDKRQNMHEKHDDYISRGYTEHFQKWGESDLKRSILRDRNHPSIFEWSIGNEIEWTYKDYKHVSGLWDEGAKGYWNRIPQITVKEMQDRYKALPDRKYKLAETAKRLSKWVKEMDTTRPVTANLIIPVASLASGYADALDIVGFSYQVKQYDWSKKNYPNMHFTGNENGGAWQEWNSILEDPMIYSMYMWTGIDYLGESNKKWPQKGWDGDMLDFAGFEKQGWNYFKSIWVNKPHVSIGTFPITGTDFKVNELSGEVESTKKSLNWNNSRANMHWNYKKGDTIIVEVPTNLEKAALFLNDKTLGYRSLSDNEDRVLRWAVPFEAGRLTVKAGFDGAEVVSELKTASEAVGIKLNVDKKTLDADGYDVSHIVAQLVDKDGIPVKTDEKEIQFQIDGDVRLLGVDNGSNKSIQDFQSNKVVTNNGKCLAIIQSTRESGTVKVIVSSKGLKSQEVTIEMK